jgi:hypothetical protein
MVLSLSHRIATSKMSGASLRYILTEPSVGYRFNPGP